MLRMQRLHGKSRFACLKRLQTCVYLTTLSLALCAQDSGLPVASSDDIGAPMLAPANAEFLQWQSDHASKAMAGAGQALDSEESEYKLGYIPSPLSSPQGLAPRSLAYADASGEYPTSYDLRTLGQVTAVRNQNPYGTCWTFGAMASLESSQLKAGRGVWDLSEWYLAYYGYNNFDSNFVSFTQRSLSSGDPTFDQGGNNEISTAILARGTGAVEESDCPYVNYNPYDSSVLPTGSESTAVNLRSAINLGGSFSSDYVKYSLTNLGAVSVPIYWSSGSYSSANASYRYTTTGSTNHIVTIVGWDDDYAASNFPSGNQPSSNGAWIVRNSWGSGWGSSGYFYLSYDSYIGSAVTFLSDSASYEHTYQYDALGWVSSMGWNQSSAWMANVFTAQASEAVSAISFYAAAANTEYQIQVKTGVTGSPSTGTLATTQTGTLEYSGYHTVALTTPVTISEGEKFAVIVKVDSPGASYPVAMEKPYSNYSDKATANAGESYVRLSDSYGWTDLTTYYANANVCIKAFGKQIAPTITSQPASVTVNSGQTATFTVVASGGTSPSYQWYRRLSGGSWAAISGATSASYTTAATTYADHNTTYFVRVISGSQWVNSVVVSLSVNPNITFSKLPTAQTVDSGQTATFSVVAAAEGAPLSYQWFSRPAGGSWAAISGATSTTYTTAATTYANNNTAYFVRVISGTKWVNSAVVSLLVNPKITISAQPVTTSVYFGQTATFSVTAAAQGAPLSYQWYCQLSGGSWAAVSGATAASYTTAATVSADNNKKYFVRVTAGSKWVNTGVVTLLVANPDVLIITQPANQSVTLGQAATFTVNASAWGVSLSYQWYSRPSGGSWAAIPGATTASYTTAPTVSADNNKTYFVKVTSAGSKWANSAIATLTVK